MRASVGNKSENTSSSFRSILAKIGSSNVQIRTAALKRIVFKLESNLITLSDLIHEREFILNLIEWFNHPEVTQGHEVLQLLLRISEYPIPARYLNSIGTVTYLSQLRQDVDESDRCILDRITDNLLHTSHFDVPKQNELLQTNYTDLYGTNSDTTNYTELYGNDNGTVSTNTYPIPSENSIQVSLPSDLSRISIASDSSQATKSTFSASNTSQLMTQSDRSVIQSFIMTSRTDITLQHDVMLSMERVFSEYQLGVLVSFHNFTDCLNNLTSYPPQQDTMIQRLRTLNLFHHILTTYKLHSNLSTYISNTQSTNTSIEIIQFLNNLLTYSNSSLQGMLSRQSTTLQLNAFSIQLDVIAKCIITLSVIFNKSYEDISNSFVPITNCIQTIQLAIREETNDNTLLLLLTGLVVITDKLCVLLRYIQPQSLSQSPGTGMYTVLDLVCSSMLNSWLPELRTYISPFLYLISPDTPKIFSRFLEVEEKYSETMDLVRILNRIRLKKIPIEIHYPTVLSLCQDSMTVISTHNDSTIIECVVEICYWLLHEERMGMNDDVIDVLKCLLESYTLDQAIALTAFHKLCSLLKHELSGKELRIFPIELVELLARRSVVLKEFDVNVWSSTWDLVFFLVTRIDNGMLIESISKWIGEFQMAAYDPEMIENIFKRFTSTVLNVSLEILKVNIRFCFHKDDQIREKATELLRRDLGEGVKFREDLILNCRAPVTEHKVGFRIPFYPEDVQKILNIITSQVLEARIVLSAFEQLCVLLQDPKLHSLMNESTNISLLIDNINNNMPENVDFAHAGIYSLRLLTQFNRKLAVCLSNNAKLITSLLYWTPYSVELTQTYNISKLLFLLVFVDSLKFSDTIQVSRYLHSTLVIPFDVLSTDSNQSLCVLDSYSDLLGHRHMNQGLASSWEYELARNQYEYSKVIGKKLLTNFKFILPNRTIINLLRHLSDCDNKEETLTTLSSLVDVNLSYTKPDITCTTEIVNKLLHADLSTKLQLICFNIILKLANPPFKYTQELIYITEVVCSGKNELYTRFISLLEMVTSSNISPLLFLEYRGYLQLYQQLAVSLATLPNLHTHIVFITFYTVVITALKHDVIRYYHDITLLLESVGKLIRPNGQARRFLCYSKDTLYLTLLQRVKSLSEDILVSSARNTNSANQTVITDSLYNLHCTLNVLDSAREPTKATSELIGVLTQLITAGEETQVLVLSVISVIAIDKSSIDKIDNECIALYGHSLLDVCKCFLLDGEDRSCLVREQVCYIMAVVCDYCVIDSGTVREILANFANMHDYVQSLYHKDRVKTPLTVSISLLASLTALMTKLLNSNQLDITLLPYEKIIHMFRFYSDVTVLIMIKLSTAIQAQFQLINSLSSLLVLVISRIDTLDYTGVLQRAWNVIEFTNTHANSYLSNYKHVYILISKLIAHEATYLCQFIQLLHSNGHALLESLRVMLESETLGVSECFLPLSLLSSVAELIRSLAEENTREYGIHGELLCEFFDSYELASSAKLIHCENAKATSVSNGSKIAELILNIISKSHPISKVCVSNDFNILETELSVFISSSKEVCLTLENCGFLSTIVDDLDSLTTKLYKQTDKSNEYKDVTVSIQTKCSLLANIFSKLPIDKELILKQGLLGIISKLWPFARKIELLDRSVIYLLTVLTSENEMICKAMSQPQGGPNLLNDIIKRMTFLLKHLKNDCRLTPVLLTLVGNSCVAIECRRFIQKIGFVSELHVLLENTRDKKCKIPRLIISNTLLLLTKLNSQEDGRKTLFQYKEVLEIASQIGQEHFKDREILFRVFLLIHNQSFSQSSKSYILSCPSILAILDNGLVTQECQYLDLIGNTISALLCKFNKGKFLLKNTKLVRTLRETNTLLSECKRENTYLAQAVLYLDTTQCEVQYN